MEQLYTTSPTDEENLQEEQCGSVNNTNFRWKGS